MNELDKVRKNLATWLKCFNNKDLDTLFTLYDPESVYANAKAPLMCGVDQIRPWYENVIPNMQGTLLFKEENAFQEGNMALLSGKFYFKPPVGNNGSTGRVALVYRKSADGEWKLLFDMDNSAPDCTPEDFE